MAQPALELPQQHEGQEDDDQEDYVQDLDMAYTSEGETLTDGELSGAEELPPRQEPLSWPPRPFHP